MSAEAPVGEQEQPLLRDTGQRGDPVQKPRRYRSFPRHHCKCGDLPANSPHRARLQVTTRRHAFRRIYKKRQEVAPQRQRRSRAAGWQSSMRSNLAKQFAVPRLHGRHCTHHVKYYPREVCQSGSAMRSGRALDQIFRLDATCATDLDDACYEEAVAALGLGKTSARNREPGHATRRRHRPPRGATSTPARGGRQLTPRCPPRCRSRRRQVEAHAPTAG